MICKKLACVAAAAVIGATLIVVPAQARFGGFGGGFGGMHVGGFGGMHAGGFGGMRVGGFGGGFVGRPAFGRAAFVGRPFINRGFFPGRRIAFFPRRRFIAPFFGVGALFAAGAYSSCWTWVPTAFGWQRVWACDYGDGYGYGY
jgi:hypothetical protein